MWPSHIHTTYLTIYFRSQIAVTGYRDSLFVYVPLCILTALFVQSLLITRTNDFPTVNIENLLASLPTILTAILTKNLMWIVIVGIISMALIRFIA